jgi:excisionase family DNA binding protein
LIIYKGGNPMSGIAELGPILTVPETAEYLKLSKSKVYLLVQRNQIPHLKIGKNVRIRREDLLVWLEKKACPSSEFGIR